MKFTLSWLKDHLETDASPVEIADRLTTIGLEVEELANPAAALAPFKVAKVLTADKHPQADKLRVLTVDAGDGPAHYDLATLLVEAGRLPEAVDEFRTALALMPDSVDSTTEC